MDKAELISRVAYANTPEGSRMISRDMPGGLPVTQFTAASSSIMQARMLREVLEQELTTLPTELTAEHRSQVAAVIDAHFTDMSEMVFVPAIRETIETDRQTCLRKLTELLG